MTNPFETNDESAPLRLIPRSGKDPDLRDELNQRASNEIDALGEEIDRIEARIREIWGERDYQLRAERIALRSRRRDLINRHNSLLLEFEAAILAAFESVYPGTIERSRLPDE